MQNPTQNFWESSLLGAANQAYLEQQYANYLRDPNSIGQQWTDFFANMDPAAVMSVSADSSGSEANNVRPAAITPIRNESPAANPIASETTVVPQPRQPEPRQETQYSQDHITSQPATDTSQQQRRYHPAMQSHIGTSAVPRIMHNKAVSAEASVEHEKKQTLVYDLVNAYRLLGHLRADTDPLHLYDKPDVPELSMAYYGLTDVDLNNNFFGSFVVDLEKSLHGIIDDLNATYCNTVASEYMHIPDSEERNWVQERVEATIGRIQFSREEKLRILECVTAAQGLEKYLGSKYPGAKRFGLEGCDNLIVLLDRLIQYSGAQGTEEIVIGMAHRGRLNVLVNILGKRPCELFDEFEGKHSVEVESGDVKYHQGFSSDVQTPGGNVHLSLAFNPSHLAIVSPVASGSVRARQERRGDAGTHNVLPINIHGDAAFAGQGVVMEILNMSQTRGYAVGGTIHIIINNQVGFTTSNPRDARSTLYCSDIGKMISAPIFHVNADDAEAVCAVCNIALDYRTTFNKDVIIDLVGYRRHGHNEADEPSATQPMMYKIIKSHKTARDIYATKLESENTFNTDEITDIANKYKNTLDERDKVVVKDLVDDGWKSKFSTDWSPYSARDWRIPTRTQLPLKTLKELADLRDTVPENFTLNSRVKKIVDNRRKMTQEDMPVDWGYAETLAYASLLMEGHSVRLSGQDCGRGTFFHRHSVWHDQTTGNSYTSLCNLSPKQGKFTVIDSLLSEAAVLGFEYGFSTSEPRTLTIWEAQFGDFANGAQIVIDQFISSGEQKWGRLSGLTMFLPHGYEGQGPEHSSSRLERYLQLCAEHNIQVCIPSTPAQVYHMIRRQLLRPIRKPLVVMTPKSLLRHKLAVSNLRELAEETFYPVIDDKKANHDVADRLILSSGKVYYELLEIKNKLKLDNVALVRIEQLYPFPEKELRDILHSYANTKLVVWCQEEPKNQGAWYNSQHHFQAALSNWQQLVYAGRSPAAAPAVGYAHLHKQQQRELLVDALGLEKYNQH